MSGITLIKSRTPEQQHLAALRDLRAHILFMIEFYHRTRAELGFLPDPDLPRPKTPLEEAVQRTWVLLLNHASRINDAECLPGWLSTTARREALAIVRGQQRAIPSEDVTDHVSPDDRDLATAMLERELTEALHDAVEALPETQRRLVRALLREPASYDALSRELGIPRGSLGPLRGRAVRALRTQLEPCFA